MSPIFEYLCLRCTAEKRTEEVLFYLTANKPPKENPNCPNRGSSKTMRKWNPVNVKFKGDGFYSSRKDGDDLNV
jgi:predicted nucleic acid-binding Zn ribbon protein